MDILVSSNLERLLFDLSGCDGARIARFMGDLAGKKRYAIDDAMKAALQQRYFAGCVDENGVREEIRRTWAENHYLMDTHTAVASAVLRAYQAQTGDTRQSVIVSTAVSYTHLDVYKRQEPRAPCGLTQRNCRAMLRFRSSIPIPLSLIHISSIGSRACTRAQS